MSDTGRVFVVDVCNVLDKFMGGRGSIESHDRGIRAKTTTHIY